MLLPLSKRFKTFEKTTSKQTKEKINRTTYALINRLEVELYALVTTSFRVPPPPIFIDRLEMQS